MKLKQTGEHIRKWRLILGSEADPQHESPLEATEDQAIDQAVAALYESDRQGGLGASHPNVNRWLEDIRRYFPSPVVQLMQRDALERLGLKKMLLEPELLEALEPDVELVATLLSLREVIPHKTRATAREVVAKLVAKLQAELRYPMEAAVRGALTRSVRNRHPKFREIDWHQTIRANLKHYQPSLKTVIPEILIGQGRKRRTLKQLILVVDQSASMASSLVYAGVLGSILASLPSLQTHFIVFDTSVADLSKHLDDPVSLLFGTQLGGGTDIAKAIGYAESLIRQPKDTILVLISDLYEGDQPNAFLQRAQHLKASGVQFICLLALDDKGKPAYDRDLAARLNQLDIPVFGCTPNEFPALMGQAIAGQALTYNSPGSTGGKNAPTADSFPG